MPDIRIVDSNQNTLEGIAAANINRGSKGNSLKTSPTNISGDVLVTDDEFNLFFYDYDSNNNPSYIGRYRSATAQSGDQDCNITKVVYFANQLMKSRQILTGSWANHNSLNWTIK